MNGIVEKTNPHPPASSPATKAGRVDCRGEGGGGIREKNRYKDRILGRNVILGGTHVSLVRNLLALANLMDDDCDNECCCGRGVEMLLMIKMMRNDARPTQRH